MFLHAIESSVKSKVYDMINKISFKFIDNSAAKNLCGAPYLEDDTLHIKIFVGCNEIYRRM